MRKHAYLSVLLAMPGLGSCASDFEAYEGALRTDSELAVIRGGLIDSIRTDGASHYEGARDGPAAWIKLRPGRYEISYAYNCYKSPEARYTDTVELVAGHAYRAKSACGRLIHFFSSDTATYLWLEDETTRTVIAGSKPS